MKKTVIIIGGGIAGLSAGYFLQNNLYETIVFEKSNRAGGLSCSWRRGDYLFDLSMHWLCGVTPAHPYYKIWNELCIFPQESMMEFDIVKKIEYKTGQYINLYADLGKFEQELTRAFPPDKELIHKFIEGIKSFPDFSAMEKPMELMSISEKLMFLSENKKGMEALGYWGKYSVQSFSDMFHDPEAMKTIINGLVCCGNNINILYILYSLSTLKHGGGVGLIKGGAEALISRMADTYTKAGGAIYTGAQIEKIIMDNKKAVGVELKSGEIRKGDYVVAACDMYELFAGLLPDCDTVFLESIQKKKTFPSIVQVSLGVNQIIEDVSQNIKCEKPFEVDMENECRNLDIRIVAGDGMSAPIGKTIIEATVYASYELWDKTYRENYGRYLENKKKIADEVITVLDKRWSIRESIEVIDVSTPATIKRYTENRNGSILGWTEEIDAKQVAKNLPENCYIIGQWSSNGMSMPRAGISGKSVARLIADSEKKEFCLSAEKC